MLENVECQQATGLNHIDCHNPTQNIIIPLLWAIHIVSLYKLKFGMWQKFIVCYFIISFDENSPLQFSAKFIRNNKNDHSKSFSYFNYYFFSSKLLLLYEAFIWFPIE